MSEAMELAHDRIMDIEATPKAASLTLSGDPVELIQNATRIATALADVIEKKHLYIQLGKKKHVYVEGWTTLLAMQGCLPREESVVELPDGRYVATVAYVQMATGVVVTRASAECGGPEEELWQKRPPFTRRSMAITRAAGKGARLAYSWIMTLAGYEATPAEEMDGVKAQFVTPPTPVGTMGALGVGTQLRSGDPHYVQPQRATVPFVPASAPSARELGDESEPEIPESVKPTGGAQPPENYTFRFGKHKGQTIDQVPLAYLEWWRDTKAKELDAGIDDERKAGYAKADHKRAVTEIARRKAIVTAYAPDEEDIPF